MENRLAECQRVIGHHFANPELLEVALTHSSLRTPDRECNERLEFLGDSVLGLVVTEELYRLLPDQAEGELTRIKSAVVSRGALYRASMNLGLAGFASFARGVGKRNELPVSVIANLVESVIGAIYLDAGIYPAREFVLRHLGPELEDTLNDRGAKNYKSLLQHEVQQGAGATPTYRMLEEEGPHHKKVFRVAALIRGREWGRATGTTKKEAEQEAARRALEAWERRGRGRRRRGGSGPVADVAESDVGEVPVVASRAEPPAPTPPPPAGASVPAGQGPEEGPRRRRRRRGRGEPEPAGAAGPGRGLDDRHPPHDGAADDRSEDGGPFDAGREAREDGGDADPIAAFDTGSEPPDAPSRPEGRGRPTRRRGRPGTKPAREVDGNGHAEAHDRSRSSGPSESPGPSERSGSSDARGAARPHDRAEGARPSERSGTTGAWDHRTPGREAAPPPGPGTGRPRAPERAAPARPSVLPAAAPVGPPPAPPVGPPPAPPARPPAAPDGFANGLDVPAPKGGPPAPPAPPPPTSHVAARRRAPRPPPRQKDEEPGFDAGL